VAFITKTAKVQLAAAGVQHVDHFMGSFFGAQATREHLISLLDELPQGISELMCHPGIADEVLSASASYIVEREAELEILTNPDVVQFVKTAGIKLSTYQESWSRTQRRS
jgi:predicted glycoside hydrolase/deacetylase ChbG (UPF0249 family)